MELILASTSATRRAMLEGAGVSFRAVAPGVDEELVKRDRAQAGGAALALALAEAKALAVTAPPEALVLGGDSVLEVNGRLFDKPGSRAEAAEHLAAFSGAEMHLHSAVALAQGGAVAWTHAALARLQVREFGCGFVAHYLDREWPALAGAVGCFRIEGLGVQLFDHIDGDYFTILGMPLLPVLGELRRRGLLPR